MSELDMFGTVIEEKYGSHEMDWLTVMIITEEIAQELESAVKIIKEVKN